MSVRRPGRSLVAHMVESADALYALSSRSQSHQLKPRIRCVRHVQLRMENRLRKRPGGSTHENEPLGDDRPECLGAFTRGRPHRGILATATSHVRQVQRRIFTEGPFAGWGAKIPAQKKSVLRRLKNVVVRFILDLRDP